MPSEKVLELKKQAVSELAAKLNDSVAGVVVEYKGVNVADDTVLRRELREAGVYVCRTNYRGALLASEIIRLRKEIA